MSSMWGAATIRIGQELAKIGPIMTRAARQIPASANPYAQSEKRVAGSLTRPTGEPATFVREVPRPVSAVRKTLRDP